jgi:hypothetical protein
MHNTYGIPGVKPNETSESTLRSKDDLQYSTTARPAIVVSQLVVSLKLATR